MKIRIIAIVTAMLALLLASCSTLTPEQKREREIKRAQAIVDKIEDQHFKIDVTLMYPQSGRQINLTSTFSLEVAGDTVKSYLPFFGRAYSVPYGGGKALNFETTLQRYTLSQPKPGLTGIYFQAPNDEDTYEYYLEVWDNGRTSITVTSVNRETMRYEGTMTDIHTDQ